MTSEWKPRRLKFTEENFKRHVTRGGKFYRYTRKVIHTTRDEMKGRHGDVFDLGCGLFVLDRVLPYRAEERGLLVRDQFANEGFLTEEAFREELDRLYPEPKTLYVHIFKELFFGIEPLCYTCGHMGKISTAVHDNGLCRSYVAECDVYGCQDLACECVHYSPSIGGNRDSEL